MFTLHSDMVWIGVFLGIVLHYVSVSGYGNETLPRDRSVTQLMEFKLEHPKPIGLITLGSGSPAEIRDFITINSDLLRHDVFFETQSHLNGERIPQRLVASKGTGAWGYFEVTNDVSKYTKADVFNGIGKKTPALTRFSVGYPGTGGTDLGRDLKDMAVKLYTTEGILDFLSLQMPIFAFKDPNKFPDFIHAFDRRNPKSNLIDLSMVWDLALLHPHAMAFIIFLFSDYGLPNGWTRSDFHPLHTYELNNKYGERWYARFNWRTERGRDFITDQQALQTGDLDYYIRDLYNAIENKTYPSWRLEMDILSLHDIQTVDFNPFDVTRLWKNGTYRTVTVGRLILNRSPENQFRDIEQAAFSPANLVPGIPGPVDTLFRGRRFAYRDAQNYRIGRNHLKVGVNSPDYAKSYVRDGHPPVGENGRDSPIYYPNSFNGPIPNVDDKKPREYLQVLETAAIDLQQAADIYHNQDEGAKQRNAQNIARSISTTLDTIQDRVVIFFNLIDPDFAKRIKLALAEMKMRKTLNYLNNC